MSDNPKPEEAPITLEMPSKSAIEGHRKMAITVFGVIVALLMTVIPEQPVSGAEALQAVMWMVVGHGGAHAVQSFSRRGA